MSKQRQQEPDGSMMPLAEELRQESYLIGILRHVFSDVPSADFLREVASIDIIPEENDIDQGLNAMARAVRENAGRLGPYADELSVHFSKLFLGPRNPPAVPYASFYLSETRTLMSAVTVEVRKRYLDAGMVVKELFNTPEDHIGIELEFIGFLTGKAMESLQGGHAEAAAGFLQTKERFVGEHMCSWVSRFADDVIANGEEEFYAGAALALKGLILATEAAGKPSLL